MTDNVFTLITVTTCAVLAVLYLYDQYGMLRTDRWALARLRCPQCVKAFLHHEAHQASEYIAAVGNPLFNVRRAAKNCVALEDHLEHEEMRCERCIQKHMLLIEVLLEEAIGLDRYGKYQTLLSDKPKRFRELVAEFNTRKDYLWTAQRVRDLRHELTQASFNTV